MKISVVGSINMDMTIVAERIPARGETVKGKKLQYIPGGKGANQAVAMARLGAEVTMFGCVGDDENGKILLENLKVQGVETDYIMVEQDVPTGVAIITVGNRDNTIVVAAAANDRVDCTYVDSIKEELLKSDVVLLQHEIPMETVEYVVDICHQNHIPVILNPAPACPLKESVIEKVTYLTPNEHEAEIIFGQKAFWDILKKYPEKLVVTLGSKGAAVCLKTGEILEVSAAPVRVVDTTGAGDTLNGAFCVMVSEGNDLKRALRFANIAAGISTEKFGAQGGMPTRDEVVNSVYFKNIFD